MLLNFLKAKLHQATVTETNIEYDGSVAIARDLCDAVGLHPYEQVDIYNITNGERLTTYVIEAPAGSGIISIRGAAAHKAKKGDRVIICAYTTLDASEALGHAPNVVLLDKQNAIKSILNGVSNERVAA
jgi:aspartate 1-decarboxylase